VYNNFNSALSKNDDLFSIQVHVYTTIKNIITDKVRIPLPDIDEALMMTRAVVHKKGDYILREGSHCHFIAFLHKGLIAATIIYDGKEVACDFIHEGCFFTYTEGLAVQMVSHKNFLALEDCEMLMINKNQLPAIFSINPKFESFFLHLLTEELRNRMLQEQQNRTRTMEERYTSFFNRFPDAFNRVPQKWIAGYLGIEPQSLSRLRKKMAGK